MFPSRILNDVNGYSNAYISYYIIYIILRNFSKSQKNIIGYLMREWLKIGLYVSVMKVKFILLINKNIKFELICQTWEVSFSDLNIAIETG